MVDGSFRDYLLMTMCLGATSIGSLIVLTFNTYAPKVMEELGISPTLMGFAMGASMLFSTISSLLIGYFIDRIGPVKVMFFGLLGLSISTYLVSIASDPYTIIGSRLLLGLFLPVLWPSCAKLVSLYVSLERSGVASGVYDAGSLVGLSTSFVVAGAISGWREGLIATSIIGLVYSVLYYVSVTRIVGGYSSLGAGASGSKYSVLRSYSGKLRLSIKNVVLLNIGFFLTLQTWGLLISWISLFFIDEMKLEYSDLVVYMVLLAFAGTVAEVFAGLLSDRIGCFIGRKIVIGVGQAVAVAGLTIAYTYYGSQAALYSIIIVFIAYKFASMTFWAILNDTIPPHAVGRISGLYAAIAGISLTIAPVVNGYLIEVTNSLRTGFLYTAVTLALSTLAYLALKQYYRRDTG